MLGDSLGPTGRSLLVRGCMVAVGAADMRPLNVSHSLGAAHPPPTCDHKPRGDGVGLETILQPLCPDYAHLLSIHFA